MTQFVPARERPFWCLEVWSQVIPACEILNLFYHCDEFEIFQQDDHLGVIMNLRDMIAHLKVMSEYSQIII